MSWIMHLCVKGFTFALSYGLLYDQPSLSLPIGESEPKNQKSVHAKWIQCGSTFFFFLVCLAQTVDFKLPAVTHNFLFNSFPYPMWWTLPSRLTTSPVSNKLSCSVCDARWLLLGPLCSMNTELWKVTRKKSLRKKDKGRKKQELAANKACANSTIKQYC